MSTITDTAESASQTAGRRKRWLLAMCLASTVVACGLAGPHVLQNIAEKQLLSYRLESAQRTIQIWERVFGASGESSYLSARLCRRLGRIDEALTRLKQSEDLGIGTKRIQTEYWLCLAQSGQMSQAGPHLGELLLAPHARAPEICEAFVSGYVLRHRFGDALRLLDGWLADFPNDSQAWYFRARIEAASERKRDAVTSFQRALEIAPDRNDIRLAYAGTLTELRDYEAAEEQYRQLLRTNPESADVLTGWSRWLAESGRIPEAISVCRQLIRQTEDSFPVKLRLAGLLYQNGDYSEARRLLEQLLEIAPKNPDVRFTLGRVLRHAGEHDAAREHLEYAQEAENALADVTHQVNQLRHRPDDVELRLDIATTLMTYGRDEEAIQWFQSVLDYSADNRAALEALIACSERRNQHARADHFRRRLERASAAP